MKIFLKKKPALPDAVSAEEQSILAQLAEIESQQRKILTKRQEIPAIKPSKRPKDFTAQSWDIVVPEHVWFPMVKEYFDEKDVSIVEDARDVHRLDIINANSENWGWRISVIAMLNKEFCISLFCNFGIERCNRSAVIFEHFKFYKLIELLDFLYTNIDTFKEEAQNG